MSPDDTKLSRSRESTSFVDEIASRYRIDREIGVGGMARVYLAEDLKHRRRVAVKVLRPELAGIGIERFEQEVEIVARLRHPHILPLFDSGEAAGQLYFVMPYVDGESLRAKLAREGQLPIDEAIRLTREIADALGYAHANGVIHRDIKPENVLLESGHAVVADFGIARAFAAATVAGSDNRLTATGVSLGTPVYMSPEQAAGEREIDGRSDLYSLGCVLYEMLCGAPPFTGTTMASVVHQHMITAPTPVTELRPAVPRPVAEAVSRVLAKNPDNRFDTAVAFAESLGVAGEAGVRPPRRLALAVLGVALVAAVAGIAWRGWTAQSSAESASRSRETAAALDQKYVVAIMPFENLSADSAKQYFASGIAEEVTTSLSRLSALRVLSRSAVAPFASAPDRLRRLADSLGVGTVLEGSVQMHSDSALVTTRLIDARSGQVLWTGRLDGAFRDAMSAQTEIARAIADVLQARLTPTEARRRGRPATIKLEAYEVYLRSRRLTRGNETQNREGMALLRKALALDSTFARARSDLAFRYLFLGYGRGQAYTDSGLAEVRAAIAIDPDLPHARFVEGSLLSYAGRFAEAGASYQKALELDPNHSGAMTDLGVNEDWAGRYDESLHWTTRAFALAPNSPDSYYHVETPLLRIGVDAANERYFRGAADRFPGSVRLDLNVARLDVLRGRDSAAMARGRRVIARNPTNQEARYFLAELATVTKAPDAADFIEPLVREAPEGRGDFLAESYRSQLALVLARSGSRARADSLWDAASAQARKEMAGGNESSALPMEIAAIGAVRGDTASAFEFLDRAYKAGWKDARIVALDPFFDGLRQHPRYRAAVARMQADVDAMRRVAAAAHPELFAPQP